MVKIFTKDRNIQLEIIFSAVLQGAAAQTVKLGVDEAACCRLAVVYT